jgi:hypothetical protein
MLKEKKAEGAYPRLGRQLLGLPISPKLPPVFKNLVTFFDGFDFKVNNLNKGKLHFTLLKYPPNCTFASKV